MRKKIVADYSSPEFYKYFKKNYPELCTISKSEFTTILKDYFDNIMELLMLKGIEFTMPKRLGSIRVVQYRSKIRLHKDGRLDKRKLRPDWGRCRKIWKEMYPDKSWEEIKEIKNKPVIFHENKHTEGLNYKWHWDRSTCWVTNYTAYRLDICRTNDRKLAKYLQNEDLNLSYYTLKGRK